MTHTEHHQPDSGHGPQTGGHNHARGSGHDHSHAGGHDHAGHDHSHASGQDARALNRLSFSATLHCMTGCAIGEILGLVIATALGWGDVASIALAVSLAFLFGYALTSLPLLKAGLTLGAIVPIALAVDTLSITTMEIVENVTMILVPGAMDAYLDEALFWATMLGGFVIAFPFAFLVNRALLRRGKGHALVHEYHAH